MSPTPTSAEPSPATTSGATATDGPFSLVLSLPRTTWSPQEAIEGSISLSVVSEGPVRVGGSGARGPGSGLLATGYKELGGSRAMDAAWFLDCVLYDLDPDAPLVSALTKSGGWDASDPNKTFYMESFDGPEVHLPAGTWDISPPTQGSARGRAVPATGTG